MEGKLSIVAKSLKPSPIQELSLLAQRCNAINLAEGFPDFPAPLRIKHAAIQAINSDFNQYRHVQGICDHLANRMKHMHGLDVDPVTDIVICCGQTEAFAATMFAIINPGDEVILFDPSFETYDTCITMAGGVPVYVSLEPPCWTLDKEKLMKSFTARTKAIVLNRYMSILLMTTRSTYLLRNFQECKHGPSSHLPCQKLLASLAGELDGQLLPPALHLQSEISI